MKKLIHTAATVALIVAAVSPAHAISEAYRKQLEREHKTQVQDANGYQAPVAKATHLKAVHAKKYGVDFKRGTDGIAYLDGSACATEEQNAQAASYQCGIHTVIVRAAGRIDLMKNGQFVGHMD